MQGYQPQKLYQQEQTPQVSSEMIRQNQKIKYDYIPLSSKLIDHVRRLDSLNTDELHELKNIMTQIARIVQKDFSFDDQTYHSNPEYKLLILYLEIALKIHQIFALVDVDYKPFFSSNNVQSNDHFDRETLDKIQKHYCEIYEQMKNHNGLNYVPRERTPDGRMFEHASDSRILIHHLFQLKPKQLNQQSFEESFIADQQSLIGYNQSIHDQIAGQQSQKNLKSNKYKYKKEQDDFQRQKSPVKLQVVEFESDYLIGNFFVEIQQDQNDENIIQSIENTISNQIILKDIGLLNLKKQIIFKLNKSFIDLQMNANGKADLYFHSYFWQEYLQCLNSFQDKYKSKKDNFDQISKSPNPSKIKKINSSKKQATPVVQRSSPNQNSLSPIPYKEKNDDNELENEEENQIEETNIENENLNPQNQIYDSYQSYQTVDLISGDYIFMKKLIGLAQTMQKVIVNIKKFPFDQETYSKYIEKFASEGPKISHKKTKYLEEIQRSLFVAQIGNDKKTLYLIEKLIIQLMGFCDIMVRDQAVVLLNMLYDEVDWQLQEAFRPVVRTIGQHFIININVKNNNQQFIQDDQNLQYFIGLAAPSPIYGCNKNIVTWHKIEKRNIVSRDKISTTININFGKFWKCGFFDWRLVEISDQGRFIPCEVIGKPQPVFPFVHKDQQNGADIYNTYDAEDYDQIVGNLAQGRFIVHARGIRDHTFHQIQVDFQNAQFDKTQNRFLQRGTFKDIENSIDEYVSLGVTALYIMGTLERDNCPFLNKYSDIKEYKKEDASPLAVTSRDNANQMLGGNVMLKSVVNKAKKKNIKIIVDSLARISSSRHHRQYKNLLLHYLTEDGRRNICYGTDGYAQNYEDTAMLNYRKIESWDLLINEIISYANNIGVDGIHLDNGQGWPQIMEPDLDELNRLDIDGQPAYTSEEIMAGEIVIRNENHGYWNTNIKENYPNPFFIKMSKKIWEEKPNFMIIGECWGGFMFENRQIIMARSGVIPRLYKLPVALSSLFGKKLYKDGRVENCKKENVIAIKEWYDDTRRYLPDGTIILQSSTAHSLPYPAYLYGKGTWAAIDILYLMSDVPITFMEEVKGEVFNISQQSIFQAYQTNIQADQEIAAVGLKKSNSKVLLALNQVDENEFSPSIQLEDKRSNPKLQNRSLTIAEFDNQNYQLIQQKEQQFKQSLDPRQGFDLSKIKSHYLHRRRLRQQKMVLRYGETIFLSARSIDNGNKWEENILCYARYSMMETVIIATNLSDQEKQFYIDMSSILPTFKKAYGNNIVITVKNCLQNESEPNYYFLREFIESREIHELRPYRSIILSLHVVDNDQYIFKKCLTTSIDRMKKSLMSETPIEQEQISLLFTDCLENSTLDIERFANVIGSIQSSFLDKLNLSFDKMYKLNRKLISNPDLSAKLFAMSMFIQQRSQQYDFSCPAVRAAKSIQGCNNMGKIVFATPELGRWSTVGGLGVMVDELSIGLSDLGQDIIVISPYYERNRKGQTGYLAQDPAGIHYVDNISVQVQNQKVILAVHEGVVRGVKVVFFNNGECFPSPYSGNGAGSVVFQLAVFNKAVLEYCCHRQFTPSVVVTNDWFTGLAAGYAKNGNFGTFFNQSKFIHICHNLQETYEGRIHPHNHEGDLNRIHELPRQWFSDNGNMINPSKCALINSDQWATVSKSYKEELLNGSSLAYLLKQKPNAFAFPNGIPISDRVKRMDEVAPDHLSAKRKIQMKYFNFQDVDDSICLFSFVGRITSQKGVHLILDNAENLIKKYQNKIQFLVGGPASMGEPYSAQCAHKMWNLKNKYPHQFWAAPDEFFYDGSLVNRGSDFGLMPSAFEPGGIVQHEFFVGKTPVIAFKTGGLKDSVIEFKWDSEEGSGFCFENFNHNEYFSAVERAINTYKNKEKYLKLRENAFRATMDGEIVCKAWLAEFCRLSEKNFVDQRIIEQTMNHFKHNKWTPDHYQQLSIIQEIFGNEKKQEIYCDIDQGATEKMENEHEYGSTLESGETYMFNQNYQSPDRMMEIDSIMSAFDRVGNDKKTQTFMLHNRGPKYIRVQICGSFDQWKIKHEMQFDQITNQWYINMTLKGGDEYLYKYVINDKHWVVNDEEPQKKDNAGNLNNYCKVQDLQYI